MRSTLDIAAEFPTLTACDGYPLCHHDGEEDITFEQGVLASNLNDIKPHHHSYQYCVHWRPPGQQLELLPP